MDEREQGNVSLAVLGTVFGILCSFLVGLSFINVHVTHQTASAAADAGALAATQALQVVFAADIRPAADKKLYELMQRIQADPDWSAGKQQEAIKRHTISSPLQAELLAGRRDHQVSLPSLLGYKPFFSEQELGGRLYESFQRHAGEAIIPQVRRYLADNGASGGGSISFPVHDRIEVKAAKEWKSPVFASLVEERVRFVGGRGYAMYIGDLDGNGIRYDVSGLPVCEVSFE